MPTTHTPDHHDPAPDDRDAPRLHGDETRLYEAHAARLRRELGRIVRTSDANLDEACSYAWLQLLRRDPRRDTVFAWMLRVAIHEAWRLHRQYTGTWQLLDDVEHAAPDPHEQHTALAEVLEALDHIHERRRSMLLMHAAGYTFHEIADRYQISPSRARTLVYRARIQLRATTARPDHDVIGRHP